MRCTGGGAHCAAGGLETRADFLYPMAQLQTRQLKLTGDFAHIFAGSSEEVAAALREFCGFGLRARAPIAAPEAVLHPAREGIQHLAIIDRGGGELQAPEPPGFVTLDLEFEAIPPPHASLRFARPVPKGLRLARPRHVADGQRRRVL